MKKSHSIPSYRVTVTFISVETQVIPASSEEEAERQIRQKYKDAAFTIEGRQITPYKHLEIEECSNGQL